MIMTSAGIGKNTFAFPTEYIKTKKTSFCWLEKIDISNMPMESPLIIATMSTSECPICYENITASTGLTTLPCSHSFHFGCLSGWFKKQEVGTCPCCRKEMTSIADLPRHGDEAESDDDSDDSDESDDAYEGEMEVSFNREKLGEFLKERGGVGMLETISAGWADATTVTFTRTQLHFLFIGNGAKVLTDEEWEAIIEDDDDEDEDEHLYPTNFELVDLDIFLKERGGVGMNHTSWSLAGWPDGGSIQFNRNQLQMVCISNGANPLTDKEWEDVLSDIAADAADEGEEGEIEETQFPNFTITAYDANGTWERHVSEEANKAATKLQAAWRGYKARETVMEKRVIHTLVSLNKRRQELFNSYEENISSTRENNIRIESR
jgi:hypothetical protein